MANAVLEKIRKLEEEKEKLLDQAKGEALSKAQDAIDELRELGFHFELVERDRPTRTRTATGRRSGIRDDVLEAVRQAGASGATPASIRAALGIQDGDKNGAQSVSNALSALKRANKINDKNGAYTAA